MNATSPITTSLNDWTPSKNCAGFFFRIDEERERIYRKEESPDYYGGYRILYVALGTRLAKEWIVTNFN